MKLSTTGGIGFRTAVPFDPQKTIRVVLAGNRAVATLSAIVEMIPTRLQEIDLNRPDAEYQIVEDQSAAY